jgi:hypothetical protein
MNSPELVATILKQGGRLLLVGGDMETLPRQLIEHPQILVWDDTRQNLLNKEIPSNVRVIIYNRWVSHSLVAKLNVAAKQLRAIKFPMQRPREIRELLAYIAQAEPQPVTPIDLELEIEKVNKTVEPPLDLNEAVKDTITMPATKKGEMGFLTAFIAKNLDTTKEYSVKGSKTKEAMRLWDIAQKEKVPTTKLSLVNGVSFYIRKNLEGTKTKGIAAHASRVKDTVTTAGVDDFAELERLIVDAIAAMKLVQEHLPKVRKETEKLRGLKSKFLKLLE